MNKGISSVTFTLVLLTGTLPAIGAPPGKGKVSDSRAKIASEGPGYLWRDPTDIQNRNLFYGPGGKKHEPKSTQFTFIDEDMNGTNPKYDVKDSDGVKWKVKLGAEARPETVATRLVWAVGYSANEDYFLPDIHVTGVPIALHRGRKLVSADGEIRDVRLKRHVKGEEKAGDWRWDDDPFTRSREWNGLRVLMALMNSWDLKDDNNAVYEEGPERVYLVKDLGASFGTTGLDPRMKVCKGNLAGYAHSRFITKVTDSYVDFSSPSRPAFLIFFDPPQLRLRMHLRWLGKRVPRSDARWMGQLLARLSDAQIRDAFRAAGYSREQIDGFSKVVEDRIAALDDL